MVSLSRDYADPPLPEAPLVNAGEIANALGGDVPTVLGRHDAETRLSGRLASLMGSIHGSPARFGSIEWRGASIYGPNDNWQLMEGNLMRPHLERLGALAQPETATTKKEKQTKKQTKKKEMEKEKGKQNGSS